MSGEREGGGRYVPDQMKWPLRLRSGGPLPHSSTRLIYATSTISHSNNQLPSLPITTSPKKRREKRDSTDPDIPIQPRRDHTRYQTDDIAHVLPGLFADALVGEREGVLALEGVDEEAVHEVDG